MKNNNKGFSLVELIVVIAIMAILAAVAVVGFSLYIPKAQQASDRQTISDTIDAFTLYYYSNPDGVTSGYVVLGPDGAVKYDDFGAAAMEAAFGANWETAVKLQYADWEGVTSTATYKDTSYIGKEGELLGTVDTLTSALGDFIQGGSTTADIILNGGFGDYLEDNQIDMENGKAIGNAAVLYVAQETKEKQTQIQNGFSNGLSNLNVDINNSDAGMAVVLSLYDSIKAEGVGDAAALAAVYAYAEGYAQATGQANEFHANTKFENVTDVPSVLTQMGDCFNNLDRSEFVTYAGANGQGSKDLIGYIDMMGTVDDNKDLVSGNLNSETCFTDGKIESLLSGHAAMSTLSVTTTDGQVAVILTVDENGNVKTHVAPLNWDK